MWIILIKQTMYLKTEVFSNSLVTATIGLILAVAQTGRPTMYMTLTVTHEQNTHSVTSITQFTIMDAHINLYHLKIYATA